MKKIIIFIFLTTIISTYSEVKEVVKNSEGKNILLMENKTWELEKEFESIKEFENKIKLSNVEVSAKRSNGRSITGIVINQSRTKLDYVTYEIKWMIDGKYSTLKTFTVKDLGYKESKKINQRIKLEGISGRDYEIEVLDFKWKK
ncbi:MAG: hypothetical protein WBG30_06435 [Psychrilyobacter sp.]|uniref:hypothetical protein n=1 Tax=Psychrilyobacter sp. TaxID=2586924 RepID=UPI003C768157